MTFLNPTEEDRLRVFLVAELARRTLSLGIRLNAPEAVALIADEMHFAARAGKGYDEVVAVGMNALSESRSWMGSLTSSPRSVSRCCSRKGPA